MAINRTIQKTDFDAAVVAAIREKGLEGTAASDFRRKAAAAWVQAGGGSQINSGLLQAHLADASHREAFQALMRGLSTQRILASTSRSATTSSGSADQTFPRKSWYASLFRGKLATGVNPGGDDKIQSARVLFENKLSELVPAGSGIRMTTGTVSYQTTEGLDRDLFYLDIEPKGEAKDTYLFVDGYQSTMKNYLPFVMKLVADGYRVRIYDQPSQGLSQRDKYPDTDGRKIAVTGFVNDHTTYVKAFGTMLSATVRKYGKVGVMGHSLGGSNILYYMRTNLDRAKAQISSVVLLSANVGLVDKFKRHVPVLGRLIRAYSDNYNLVLHDGLSTKRNPKEGELRLFGDVSRDEWMDMRETGTGWGLVQVEAQGKKLEAIAEMKSKDKFDIPVLVVHAENDNTSKPGPTRDVVRKMFNNPRMPSLQDGVHYPFLHVDTRDGVEATVKGFMADPTGYIARPIQVEASLAPVVPTPTFWKKYFGWMPFLGAAAFLNSQNPQLHHDIALLEGASHLENAPELHLEDVTACAGDAAVVHRTRRSVPHAAMLQASAGRVAAVRAQQSNLVMRG